MQATAITEIRPTVRRRKAAWSPTRSAACRWSARSKCSAVQHQEGARAAASRVLESAIANAEHNEGADIDELRVAAIQVDEGPTLKRFIARAKGRGARILKRTSHITVTVSDEKAKARRKGSK